MSLVENNTEWTADVVVVGAGAAGLWAAEVAARAGRSVLLIEKTRRCGTKVLASGGTKCNLTTTLPADDAARLFGASGERFLRRAFREVPPEEVRRRFHEWGVETIEAPLEKIFPATGKAMHVRDALERAADAAGVRWIVDAPVEGVERVGEAWNVAIEGGRVARAPRLILCPGGMSYPSTGTTGDGYAWLRNLGCDIVEPVPALAPLTSPDVGIRALTGIAVQDAVVRMAPDGGKLLGERARPVLFTHHGVSGPGAMDFSVHVARAAASARARGEAPPRFCMTIDLCPDLERERIRDLLIAGAAEPGSPRVGRVVPIELPRRLWAEVARRAEVGDDEPRANGLGKAQRHRLIETLKAFPIVIDGTLGFDKAEVTAGGLSLRAVDPGSMAVRGHPGLFACGEILDVSGPIGGLNFQAAFATAELAGRAAAESVG